MVAEHVREILDRVVVNDSWKLKFLNSRVIHLHATRSDHSPILLKMWLNCSSKPKPFRFEQAWTTVEECHGVFNKAWNIDIIGSNAYKFSQKMKYTKAELKVWNRTSFGDCDRRINGLNKEIEQIQSAEPTQENIRKEMSLQYLMGEILLT